MTVAQEMLELADWLEKAVTISDRSGNVFVGFGYISGRNRELILTALRSAALSLNEVGGERKI